LVGSRYIIGLIVLQDVGAFHPLRAFGVPIESGSIERFPVIIYIALYFITDITSGSHYAMCAPIPGCERIVIAGNKTAAASAWWGSRCCIGLITLYLH
jgi:hypothetical protein